MSWPNPGEILGLGFDHGPEGIPAKCALLLQIQPNFIDGGLGQCFADDHAVGFGALFVSASQVLGAIARMMQCLGRHYVAYINRTYRRTGTLWEGRYKSCLVGGDRYVLACHRYIELNPVRAAMVVSPEQYPWSSHRANAHGDDDPRLTLHPTLASRADTREAGQRYYRALFDEVLDETQQQEIRTYLQQQRALGSTRFQAAIEAQLGRCATVRPARRPIVQKAL